MNEVRDYELRVYGISNTIGLEKDIDNMSDDEWVDLAEEFGYISTLDTFIYNVNKGVIATDYSELVFRVIAFGYHNKQVDIVPSNKLHYMIRD
jgi:hypothetical protein|tara:strand:- start:774 stop:1052 length:279 start_codon:yes stop_codon:yes gene_type:complete